MTTKGLILALLDEAYERKTWHGPNLKQAIKGLTAKEAAQRPWKGSHNIWEETVHAAYWKYAVRRQLEGGKGGTFALKGSNFFERPEKGNLNETAWRADKRLLEEEHRALKVAIVRALKSTQTEKTMRMLYGVTFHDIYHAGQIRLMRRWLKKKSGR